MPGWDLAGEIAAVGDGVTGLTPGQARRGDAPLADRHVGAVGAYSELVALDAELVIPTPDGIDDPTAATIPLNALTADQALKIIDPAPGTTLLVTGASGAVGAFAAQFAVQLGAGVIAQAGRDDEDFVWSLGVEDVLPRDADLTAIDEVDNVVDAVPVGPVAATRMAAAGPPCSPAESRTPRPEGQRSEVVLCKAKPSPCAGSSPTSGTTSSRRASRRCCPSRTRRAPTSSPRRAATRQDRARVQLSCSASPRMMPSGPRTKQSR